VCSQAGLARRREHDPAPHKGGPARPCALRKPRTRRVVADGQDCGSDTPGSCRRLSTVRRRTPAPARRRACRHPRTNSLLALLAGLSSAQPAGEVRAGLNHAQICARAGLSDTFDDGGWWCRCERSGPRVRQQLHGSPSKTLPVA
jgi:hypothetical protein